MPSPKAAPRAAVPKVVTRSLAMLLSPARAEASRRNGAKSKGPRTPEGKARSAQNAIKHGLRAQKYVVLPEEDGAEFEALEQAIIAELAPVGALQTALARRVVAATWRLARAERLEADIFEIERRPGKSLGLALIRDCNGARAFDTLLRYRGGTLAELWRALRTLKALQAERRAAPTPQPDEPEARSNPGDSSRPLGAADTGNPALASLPSWPLPTPAASAPSALPIGPETRGEPAAARSLQRGESASLLAGTALSAPTRIRPLWPGGGRGGSRAAGDSA